MKIRTVCKMTRSRALNRGISRALNSASLMVALVMLTPLGGFAQQPSPSLEETATWLQNTYANHGTRDWGSGSFKQSLVITGCNARMTSVSAGTRGDGTYNSVTGVLDVSLQDLDPASIKTSSTGHITLQTTNGKKSMKATVILMDGSSTVSMESQTDWGLDNDEYMERAKTAWIHAIQLCGGKSSAF